MRNAQSAREGLWNEAGSAKWKLRLKFELYDRRYDEETTSARSRSVEITGALIRAGRSVFYCDENIMRGHSAPFIALRADALATVSFANEEFDYTVATTMITNCKLDLLTRP